MGMGVRFPLSYAVIDMTLLAAHSDLPRVCHTTQIN